MFNAFLWIARSGAAWRDLPEERYGSWKTTYSRFYRWRDSVRGRQTTKLHAVVDGLGNPLAFLLTGGKFMILFQ
ncbi:hypothetical protein D3C87_1919170 [compost metagenome]